MNIKCFDSGPNGSCDRYTVVYLDHKERERGTYSARAMSSDPFHPQGFGQMCIAMPGRHLGKRIKFEDLPEDCQKVVKQDLS